MSVAEQMEPAAAPVPTPCIGVCEIDEATGLCKGCARTGEEVAAWQEAEADYKLRVWDALPPRRAEASLNAYRLPWSLADIACMVERTLRRRWGRWVLGIDGACASFEIGADEDADIDGRPDAITAMTARGGLRLTIHPKTVAVAFGDAADANGPEAIGLVLPRGRVDLRGGDALAGEGADVAAICGAQRGAQLFDLGVTGDLAARFKLRTDHPELIEALSRASGRPWREALDDLDTLIDLARPHTVVETALGRAEIFSPPTVDGVSGTSAELNAAALRAGAGELPSGWTLPKVFAPSALFYPHSRKPAQAMLDGHY